MAFLGRPSERDEERPAGWAAWFQRQNPFALSSLPLSLFSLSHFGTLFVDEIAGIAFGVVALRQLARARDDTRNHVGRGATNLNQPQPRAEGRWLAWAGIVIGVISLAVAVAIYFVLPGPRAVG